MIRQLPKEVINKIAAGQAINRPVNAIKQLIQNSIDALSNSITINVLQGGLKKIQIIDNGNGILLQDFPLLCQRNATSKIQKLDDLNTIHSFGFRGEALASLSYVTESLQIRSKHSSSKVGYKAFYKNQALVNKNKESQKVQIFSMPNGTHIIANNLFSNMQSRKKSLNPSQQRAKILSLVSHFGIHYPEISFNLNSQKGNLLSTSGIKLKKGQELKQLSQQSQNTLISNRMRIFKMISKIPMEFQSYLPNTQLYISTVKFNSNNNNDQLDNEQQEQKKDKSRRCFIISGIFSKLNTQIKGKTILITINNRIVNNESIVKSIDKAYSECYNSIHQQIERYFCYISIKVDPLAIDCNVDPKKQLVKLINQKQISIQIRQTIQDLIKKQAAIKNLNIIQNQTQHFKRNNIQNCLTNKQKIGFYCHSKNKNINQKLQQSQNNYLNNHQSKKIQSSLNYQKNYFDTNKVQYAYNKKRIDNNQISMNYYIKQTQNQKLLKENQSSVNHEKIIQKQKLFKYQVATLNYESVKLKPQSKDLNGKLCLINKFFRNIQYVGCFNTQVLFIQYQANLYALNIVPYIPAFLRFWLYGHTSYHPLYLTSIKKTVNVIDIVQNFITQNQLQSQIKAKGYKNINQLTQIIVKVQNRQFLSEKYGIQINWEGNIQTIPLILQSIEIQNKIIQSHLDDLAFLLCKFFNTPNRSMSVSKQQEEIQNIIKQNERFFFQFLSLQFESSNQDLSPFNNIYSNFFKNELMPFMKLKVRFDNYYDKQVMNDKISNNNSQFNELNYKYMGEKIKISQTLTQMLDLKKAYQYFQRC